MRSMTGFACAQTENGGLSLSLEIKGYNSRFLEISVFLPPQYGEMEAKIRSCIEKVCIRGKVEVYIKIKEKHENISVYINKDAVNAYIKAAKELRPDETLPLSSIFTMQGVVEAQKTDAPSSAAAWELLSEILEKTLCRFDLERRREGDAAKKEIEKNANILRNGAMRITGLLPEVKELIKKNIRERFLDVLANEEDVERKIFAESASLLMKWTIEEEITRLNGHLEAFSQEIEKSSPGKRLEFLCQEINREINTISSKTPLLEVSRAVVDCKEMLENIREQLRNVE
ncbi:MAG: YicC family protein [Spirochaetaceae bacterium]|jgi:uncharacterized protein (TIGR00255 family)|nr:YicC family protein [Spirochaetaceae bacterium]